MRRDTEKVPGTGLRVSKFVTEGSCASVRITVREWPMTARESRKSVAFDPVASLLEEIVGPHLIDLRRASFRTWAVTLDRWVEDEEHQTGHDTQRLSRLIDRAWRACTDALAPWDPRFALQAVRSLPNGVIIGSAQFYDEPSRGAEIVRVLTAAAASSTATAWPRRDDVDVNSIPLSPEQLCEIAEQAPAVLGDAIGAARLTHLAQIWYRSAGKGRRIHRMPARVPDEKLKAIDEWDGRESLLADKVTFAADPSIDEAIARYEARRDAAMPWRDGPSRSLEAGERRFWHVAWRGLNAPLPLHVSALDITFPQPSWYPVPDLNLEATIGPLRPFDDVLRERLGLQCDELLVALHAVGKLVAHETHCAHLEVKSDGEHKAFHLDSPATDESLTRIVGHLASVIVRGTIRSSVDDFVRTIGRELEELEWPNPRELASRLVTALTAIPSPQGLPAPSLFYVLDPATCVLDLSRWGDFATACLALVTSGDGDLGRAKGALFEQKVRDRLTAALRLEEQEIPWQPSRDVWEAGVNLGDVDFCFLHGGVLVHLDMKNWQRGSDYHIGHYHTIQARQNTLVKQMEKLERRGAALQRKLNEAGAPIAKRSDFLIVASPEYLALDLPTLWYGNEPRVLTVDELLKHLGVGEA